MAQMLPWPSGQVLRSADMHFFFLLDSDNHSDVVISSIFQDPTYVEDKSKKRSQVVSGIEYVVSSFVISV